MEPRRARSDRPTILPLDEELSAAQPASGPTIMPIIEDGLEAEGPALPPVAVANLQTSGPTIMPISEVELTEPREAAAPLVRGLALGRWVLDRKLGEGATAEVWAANHAQLGSPVAIKVFHDQTRSFKIVLGEARAAAGIPSPYAIWVYDVDRFEGHLAIVMELCAADGQLGESLRDTYIESFERAARLIAEAAKGVEAAHRGHIFHKDIKPANILINPDDGRAQITDFGLANPVLWRALSKRQRRKAQSTVSMEGPDYKAPMGGDPHSTIRGRVRVGTPEFMAPEQAGGLRPDLDPHDPTMRDYLVAMDVYGLGATLYHLLAGVPPYPHSELDETATAEQIMRQVVSERPVPLRTVNPLVPRRLAAIVDKAMRLDPLDRYRSAMALADDLDAWLAHQPTDQDSRLLRMGVHLHRERGRAYLLLALAGITLGSSLMVARNMERIQAQESHIATQTVAMDAQRREMTELDAQRQALEGSLAEMESSLNSTRGELDKRTGQLQARVQELKQRSAKVASLSQELTATSTHLERKQAALGDAELKIMEVTATKGQLEAALQDRESELAARKARLGQVEVALAGAEGELGRLRTSLAEEAAYGREMAESVTRLESKVGQLERDLAQQRVTVASAEGQVSQAAKSLDTVRLELKMTEGQVAGLREENAHLRRLLQETQATE